MFFSRTVLTVSSLVPADYFRLFCLYAKSAIPGTASPLNKEAVSRASPPRSFVSDEIIAVNMYLDWLFLAVSLESAANPGIGPHNQLVHPHQLPHPSPLNRRCWFSGHSCHIHDFFFFFFASLNPTRR
jgi:hypothetical protein